jgi:hypothetical protein
MFIKIQSIVIRLEDIVAIGPSISTAEEDYERTLTVTVCAKATGTGWHQWDLTYDTPEDMRYDLAKAQEQLLGNIEKA